MTSFNTTGVSSTLFIPCSSNKRISTVKLSYLLYYIDMAWRCTGNTNTQLIHNMSRAGIISSDRVVAVSAAPRPNAASYGVYTDLFAVRWFQAMGNVDRAHYVLQKSAAYQDSPQYVQLSFTTSTAPIRS